jgi:hypothetical protein
MESIALPIDHLLVSVLGGVLLGTQEKHVLQEAVMSISTRVHVSFTSKTHQMFMSVIVKRRDM